MDVSVSRRMGLFVVGRLSQRHGIRIQLRPSDSGGTTALVMLPVDVAQGGKKPQGKPGQGGAGGPAAAQAAAGVAAARRDNGGSLGAGAPARVPSGRCVRWRWPARCRPGAAGRAAGPGLGRPSGAPGGARGPQMPQGRPTPAGMGSQASGGPQGQDGRGNVPPQRGDAGAGTERSRRGRQPQLPPRGGARAELPGSNQQSRPSWSDENAQPPVPRAALDTPRGHEEPDVSQTARMPA
ncbi:hypothetical protein [Streptomyces sp. F001]|uniref:ATP-binding protein n=1 Tax=Streptomyces sp. F001 TaxID=1510026 RepID=UPI001F109029|nr:hypothetical protein [Streptomyces sp. F001]